MVSLATTKLKQTQLEIELIRMGLTGHQIKTCMDTGAAQVRLYVDGQSADLTFNELDSEEDRLAAIFVTLRMMQVTSK